MEDEGMEDGGRRTAGWRRDRRAPGRPPPPPSQRMGEVRHGDTHARGHLVPVPGLLSPPRAPASCLAPAGCAPTAPALRGDRMSLPEPQRCSSQPEKPPIISCRYSRGFFTPSSSQAPSLLQAPGSSTVPAPTLGVPAPPHPADPTHALHSLGCWQGFLCWAHGEQEGPGAQPSPLPSPGHRTLSGRRAAELCAAPCVIFPAELRKGLFCIAENSLRSHYIHTHI